MDFANYSSMAMELAVHNNKAKRRGISRVECHSRSCRLWHLILNANNSLAPLQMSWLWKLSHRQKTTAMAMKREARITTAHWKPSNLSRRGTWSATSRPYWAKNRLIWLSMVTYLRPLLMGQWLTKKYKRQRWPMIIRMTKTIKRSKCSTLSRISRTWDM